MRPSASSSSRAVSTLKPCWVKHSLMDKQIDSSSSTTSNFVDIDFRSVTSAAVCSRPRKSSRRRPDTVLNVSIEVSELNQVKINVGGVAVGGDRNPYLCFKKWCAELTRWINIRSALSIAGPRSPSGATRLFTKSFSYARTQTE